MKHKITLILFAALFNAGQLFAQQTITVNANNSDISDNLDLEAVAYLFGEAKNLEEFENMLNDPEKQISNLDLNHDGYVDYLRVIESRDNGVYVVVIQAVLGEDIFQDVATIDVDARKKDRVIVQVIGNEYLYGPNYVFEPVYIYTPLIYDYFWYPHHTVWYSPYYWHYYPRHYHYRKPHRVYAYHRHIYRHYHKLNCHYVPYNRIDVAVHLHKKVHRNDYGERHPEQAFNRRNADVQNRRELVERRSASPNTVNRPSSSTTVETKSRRVSSDWENNKSDSRRSSSNRTSVSVSQPASKSVSVNESRRSSRSESSSRSSSVAPSSRKSSSSGSSSRSSSRSYSAPSTSQKSAPVVSTPSSSRSSSSSSVSRSSTRSSRSSSSVSSSSSSSSKPSVSRSSSHRSSSSSKPAVQKSSSKPSSSSGHRSSSSRSSSSKSSSSKSISPGRR